MWKHSTHNSLFFEVHTYPVVGTLITSMNAPFVLYGISPIHSASKHMSSEQVMLSLNMCWYLAGGYQREVQKLNGCVVVCCCVLLWLCCYVLLCVALCLHVLYAYVLCIILWGLHVLHTCRICVVCVVWVVCVSYVFFCISICVCIYENIHGHSFISK